MIVVLLSSKLLKTSFAEEKYDELVSQVSKIAKDLNEMKKSVESSEFNSALVSTERPANCNHSVTGQSAWCDAQRVQNIRSSLVIKPKSGVVTPAPDLNKIQNIAVKNNIPVSKIGFSQKGETYIHCPSAEDRDKLQPLLCQDFSDKEVVSLKEKLP